MDVGINFEGEAQQLQTAIEGLERSLVGLIGGAKESEKALQEVKLTMAQAAETVAAAEIEKKALKGIEDQAKETQKTWAGMPGSWRLTARELEASMRQVQQTWKGDAGSWRTSLDTEAEKISKSLKDLDQQMKTAVTGGVDVDTTKARAELDLLGRDALKAKDLVGDIKITARQAAESDAAGELIKHNINDIGDEADKAKRKIAEAKFAAATGGGGGGALGFLAPGGSGPLDILGSVVPGGRRATGFGLAAGITGLASLIAPLIPSLGILAAAPAMLATVTAAAVTLSLAFSDVSQAIDGNRKSYNELVPAAKQFVDLIRGDIYPLFNGLKQIAAENFFGPLTAGIKSVVDNKTALANIGGIVAELAKGMGQLAESWIKFLGSTKVTGQLGQIFGSALSQIEAMQPALQSMFSSVLKLMQAFEPLGQFVVEIFNRAAAALASFTDEAVRGGKITGWIRDIEESAKLLWGTFSALVDVIFALLQVLAPVGKVLLEALIPALHDLAGWLRNNKDEIDSGLLVSLGLLGAAFVLMRDLLKAIGPLFKAVFDQAKGEIKNTTDAIDFFDKHLGLIKFALDVLLANFKVWGKYALEFIAGPVTLILANWDWLAKNIPKAWQAALDFIKRITNDVVNGIVQAFVWMVNQAAGLINAFLKKFEDVWNKIADIPGNPLHEINVQIGKWSVDSIKLFGDAGAQGGNAWGQNFTAAINSALAGATKAAAGAAGGGGAALPPGIGGPTVNTAQTAILGEASKQVSSGRIYVRGVWDCSAFVQDAYAAAGIKIPRSSTGQFYDPHATVVTQLQPGDAVYFNNGSSKPQPDHTGIYIGGDQFQEFSEPGLPGSTKKLSTYGGYMGARRWYKISSPGGDAPPSATGGGAPVTFQPVPITPTGTAPAFTAAPAAKVPPTLQKLLGVSLVTKQTAAETALSSAEATAATDKTVESVKAEIAARDKLEAVLSEEIKKLAGEHFSKAKDELARLKELKTLRNELTSTIKGEAADRKLLSQLLADAAVEGVLKQIPGIDATQAPGITALKRQYEQLVQIVKLEGSKASPLIKEQMRLLGEAIKLPDLAKASPEERAKVAAAIKSITDEVQAQADKAVSAILGKGFSTQDSASVLSIKRRFEKLVETVKEAGGAAANKVVKEMDALREAIFGKDFLAASPAKRAQTLQLLNDLLTKMADVVKSHKAEFTNAWTQIADAAKAAFQARIDLMLADFDAQTAAWEEKFNAETQAFVTDAQAQLNQLQNESELADLQQALVDAQKQLQADMKGNTQDAQSALDAVKAVLGQWAQAQAIDKVQSGILGGKAGDASGDFLQRLQAAANSGQGKGTSTQDQIAKDTEAIKKAQVALAEYFLRGEAAKQNAAYAAKRAAELKAYEEARALVRQEFDRKLQDEMKQFDLLLAVIQAKLISDYQKGDPTSLKNADTLLQILAGVTGVSPEEVTAWEGIMKNAINATTPQQAAAIAAQINKALGGGGLDPLQGVGEAVKEAMAAGAPVSELVSILQQAGLSKDQIAQALKDAGIDPAAIAAAIANIPDAPKASDVKALPPAIAKALGPGLKGLPPNIAKELEPFLKRLPPDIAAALAPYLNALAVLLGGVVGALGATVPEGGMPHLQSGGITLGNIIAQLHGQGGGEAVIPLNSPMFGNKIAIVAPGGLDNVAWTGGGSGGFGGGRQHYEGPPLRMPDVNVTVETHVDGDGAMGFIGRFIDHKVQLVTPAISKAIGVRAQMNRREGRVPR